MPSSYVAQLAKSKGIPLSTAEDRWERAKKSASAQGQGDNYAYITGIFKTMMGEEIEDETMLEQKLSKAVKRIEEKLDGRKLSENYDSLQNDILRALVTEKDKQGGFSNISGGYFGEIIAEAISEYIALWYNSEPNVDISKDVDRWVNFLKHKVNKL